MALFVGWHTEITQAEWISGANNQGMNSQVKLASFLLSELIVNPNGYLINFNDLCSLNEK